MYSSLNRILSSVDTLKAAKPDQLRMWEITKPFNEYKTLSRCIRSVIELVEDESSDDEGEQEALADEIRRSVVSLRNRLDD